jgi:succinate dehydrogenase hydrophobic anchor subunit
MTQTIGRLIGLLVLCLLVGLLLTHLGIAARGILTDTWRTVLAVFRLAGDIIWWAVPYILLGAVVVVPVSLVALIARRGRRK